MSVDPTRKVLPCYLYDIINAVHLQIKYAVTSGAYKVIMRGSIEVVVVTSVSGSQSGNFPDIRQEVQIAVNRSKADIRKLFSNIHINGISSRMIFACAQEFFDRFSLTTVIHVDPSFLKHKNNNYYCY